MVSLFSIRVLGRSSSRRRWRPCTRAKKTMLVCRLLSSSSKIKRRLVAVPCIVLLAWKGHWLFLAAIFPVEREEPKEAVVGLQPFNISLSGFFVRSSRSYCNCVLLLLRSRYAANPFGFFKLERRSVFCAGSHTRFLSPVNWCSANRLSVPWAGNSGIWSISAFGDIVVSKKP